MKAGQSLVAQKCLPSASERALYGVSLLFNYPIGCIIGPSAPEVTAQQDARMPSTVWPGDIGTLLIYGRSKVVGGARDASPRCGA